MDNVISFAHVYDEVCVNEVLYKSGTHRTISFYTVGRYRVITPYVEVLQVQVHTEGVTPTLDIALEGIYGQRVFAGVDARARWVEIFVFPQITGVGFYRQSPFEISETEIRYRITIANGNFRIVLGHRLRT